MKEGTEATHQRLTVEDAPTQTRLDAYLAARLPDLSRSRIAQLLADGHVHVNGKPARKSRKPEAGDIVDVELPAPSVDRLEPQPIPLTIVYQDEDVAVIDKPAGLVVHPGAGHRDGTLVHALLHHLSDLSGIGGVLRPGIVHRLDKDTSGLMLVAKNDIAHRALSAALKRREVTRVYLAAAWGHLPADDMLVDRPIARSPTHRQRMAVVESGRPARTHLHRLERWRAADLIRAQLDTGRTHQIRVHLAALGHPVVGDAVYGGGGARGMSGPDQGWARELERRTPRQFLHAAELAFRHPRSGASLRFEVPLAPDLNRALEWARAHARRG